MKNMTAKDRCSASKAGFRCDFPVSVRRFALYLASMTVLAAFGLTDVYWIGGSSGNWNDASNWSSGAYPNSSDCHVKITNETPVTVSLGSSNFTLGSISFSGANHTLTGSAYNSGLLLFVGGKVLPDVPSSTSRKDGRPLSTVHGPDRGEAVFQSRVPVISS